MWPIDNCRCQPRLLPMLLSGLILISEVWRWYSGVLLFFLRDVHQLCFMYSEFDYSVLFVWVYQYLYVDTVQRCQTVSMGCTYLLTWLHCFIVWTGIPADVWVPACRKCRAECANRILHKVIHTFFFFTQEQCVIDYLFKKNCPVFTGAS